MLRCCVHGLSLQNFMVPDNCMFHALIMDIFGLHQEEPK